MAMYYYARKLQKSARKPKSQPQQQRDIMMANGSIPTVSISSVGCVSGSGSGAACASPQPQQLTSTTTPGPGGTTPGLKSPSVVGTTNGNNVSVTSSNSSTTTNTDSTANSAGSSTCANNSSHLLQIQQLQNLTCPTFSKSHQLHMQSQAQAGPSLSFGLKSPVGTNEWDNHSLGLIFEECNLVSGRLESLVEHLVPGVDYYPDRAFIFAFILSSRLFIRPHELLATVFHLAFAKSEEGEVKVVKHLVQLLGEWAEMFPFDFRDDNGLMMANVRAITHKCVQLHPPVKKDVSILLTSLLGRLTSLEKFESMLHKINVETLPQSQSATSPRVLAICPDPNLLAEQLTHIELERFSFIGAQEFLQAFLKESCSLPTSSSNSTMTTNTTIPSGPTTTNGDSLNATGRTNANSREVKTKTRLELYVQWFHRLALIVATDVCKTGKKKLRARCIEFWVEVARECFNIGNFNSLMAIITGLNMGCVARLKKTWGKLGCDLLSSLETHMDPSNNFASYRSFLKSAVWHSTNVADGRQKVVIPFFSLLIKDLYFLKEECAQRLPNGHINFEKFRRFGRQVGQLISWQQVTCPFPKVPTIIQAIQTLPSLSENALMLASFECEPPEGPQEKEMMKSLVEGPLRDSLQSLPMPSNSSTGGSICCHEELISPLQELASTANNLLFSTTPSPNLPEFSVNDSESNNIITLNLPSISEEKIPPVPPL